MKLRKQSVRKKLSVLTDSRFWCFVIVGGICLEGLREALHDEAVLGNGHLPDYWWYTPGMALLVLMWLGAGWRVWRFHKLNQEGVAVAAKVGGESTRVPESDSGIMAEERDSEGVQRSDSGIMGEERSHCPACGALITANDESCPSCEISFIADGSRKWALRNVGPADGIYQPPTEVSE